MKRKRILGMFSTLSRATVIGLAAVVSGALVVACSNDNPAALTSLNNDATHRRAAGDDRSSGHAGVVAKQNPQNLGPPAEGIVVEGVSVPGIALGFTRAQVQDAYGDDPLWCQSGDVPGNKSYCAFAVSGGGQVDVMYRGADGGSASNSPNDVVHNIYWSEAVSGWTTTAGVNTTLAKENPEAVIAAYPNAQVTYNQFGNIYRVVDYPLGIDIKWVLNFYTGQTSIRMATFYPMEAPPLPEKLTYVYDIDLTANKVKGKRQIRAFVGVRNEWQLAASGATVFARWTFPNGSTQAAESTASGSGYAYLEINDIPRGTYTLTVEDVVLEGYRFDSENSVLSASVMVK
jgi:hypothetical protein